MNYWQATFIKSAADKSGWIQDEVPEVLFVGRSNVGKSSLINALTNNKKMAKVSSAPGKTRLLNFFEINKASFRLVDAPGYGYAKISNEMRQGFEAMMEDYLTQRKNLKFVAMLVDLRHKPSNDDVMMYNYLKNIKMDVVIIGTKLDKLKQNEIKKNQQLIKNTLQLVAEDSFISTSSSTKQNLDLIDLEFKKRFKI